MNFIKRLLAFFLPAPSVHKTPSVCAPCLGHDRAGVYALLFASEPGTYQCTKCGKKFTLSKTPNRPGGTATRLALASIILLAAMVVGCSSIRQTVTSEIKHPDGTVETRISKSTILASWDAKQIVEKLRVSNGKTQGIGIGTVDSETSSTNAVVALDVLIRALAASLK